MNVDITHRDRSSLHVQLPWVSALCMASCLLLSTIATFASSTPGLLFYVPFPEADYFTALTAVESGGPSTAPANPVTTYISIAAIANGTIVYYDHWEDGYELDPTYSYVAQPTTEVWGDGNPANGYPPNITNDLIGAGTAILLYNQLNTGSPGIVDFDARDKIAATRSVSVTRTFWASGSGTLFAGCVETFDVSKWGTDFRSPIGENIPDATDAQMFQYTALSIMASRDNTTVRVDADNNGAFETTNTLNEGETAFVDGVVNVGAHVSSDKPVQVILFSGDIGSNYESRDSSLLPTSLWGSSYYTPVSTPSGDGTRVWLYNPGASGITVNYRYRIGTGSIATGSTGVSAGSYASVTLPEGAAAEFYTTGAPAPSFYAYSTTDSDSTTTSDNQAWDWSFTLIPESLLSPQVLVGLGIGRDPESATNPNENGNPVWVTSLGNGSTQVTVYVDYNGDNVGPYTDPNGFKYDMSTNVVELEQLKLYDPDGDQSALLIYVLDEGVTLAAAWGQDPTTATAGAPGLDVGTSIPPEDVLDPSKDMIVTGDSDGDGVLGPGERAEYTINIENAARASIPAWIQVVDTLSADSTYVTNSTSFRSSTTGTWSSVADDVSGTAFPLDGTGMVINASIPINDAFQIRFYVDIDAYTNLTAGSSSVINTGTVTTVAYDRTISFRNETPLHGSLGDRVWWDVNADGVQDAGETGINGVVVYLDINDDGVRDAAEPYDTTSSNGYYLLTGPLLVAATHSVRVDPTTLPAGYAPTYDLDGAGTPHAALATLLAGQDREDVDFGYTVPVTIGDFAWVDSDGNGQQDAGETGLASVVVSLYNSNGVVVATTNTSAAGAYLFADALPGTYTVGFSAPAGYLLTQSNIGADVTDSDPISGTNRTASFILASGQTNLTLDAGFYLPASLSGSVFIDVDGDGVDDPEDTTGIPGVTILLRDASSNVVASTTTDALGAYSFVNLAPGSYIVEQILPGDYTNTLDVVGANDRLVPRTLVSGQNSTGNDFWDTTPASTPDRAKILYLSDPSQALDRIDPVATGDATTTNTATLGTATPETVLASATTSAQNPDGTTVSSLSFSHTTGSGNNRLMLVAISVGNTGPTGMPPQVDTVSYGNDSMTLVRGQLDTTDQDVRSYIYSLTAPPSGTTNVVITLTGNGTIAAGATTFTGVDQTTPLGTSVSASGVGNTASILVSSQTGEMVFGTVAYDSSPTLSLPGGSGQTMLWNRRVPTPGNTLAGAASTEAGAASVTHSYSSTENQDWAIVAVPILPASGGATAVFTQAPEFALPFTITSGAVVRVTNFVNVITGSMPPNPSVTAVLSADGNPFLTMSGPTYSAGAGTMVWSGTLGDSVAIAAGDAISLTVSNQQGGVTFQILYDSITYPSQIVLPTTTIIAIPSLAVYDAPYAGGIPVASSPTGAVRYVRATVTDPFGAYDISGLDLDIDMPGAGGDIGLSLDDGDVVSSNSWSKIYEYVWSIPAIAGSYTITAVGHEGTEGITVTNTVPGTTDALGEIGDYVWADLDHDGIQDSGEPPLAGVIVYLDLDTDGIRDAGEPYETTDTNGLYRIDGLGEGTYRVAVDKATLPAGLLATYDLDGGLDSVASASLSNGQVRLDLDFGYFGTSTIGDRVWLDEDSDGVQDAGEAGIPAVTLRLYEAGPDDALGTGDDVLMGLTTTDAHGGYIFTGLLAGDYRVVVDTGTMDPTLAANPTYDPDGGLNHYADVSITTPVEIDTVDFGYNWSPTPNVNNNMGTGAIGDRVWLDVDGDGAQDPAEGGMVGVELQLYIDADTNGTYETAVASTTTDENGLYIFTNLSAGSYVVEVATTNFVAGGILNGTTQTGDPDEFGLPATVADNRTTTPVLLAPGDVFVNADFGYQPPLVATIGDLVYFDANADGTNNVADGDLPIPGVTVSLYDTNGNVLATTMTDTSGNYLFTVATAASYAVRVTDTRTVLSGLMQTADPDTTLDREHTVAVSLGNSYLDVDFGFTAYGQDATSGLIGDLVFLDQNTNGSPDEGEALEGIDVSLYDASGTNLLAVTTTDENGLYYFGGLSAATYTVRVSTNSLPNGGLGLINNVDPDAGGDSESVVVLAAGGIDLDQDFGYRESVPNAIAGTIWEDRNADGTLDGTESNRFAEVSVLLLDTNGNIIAVTTTDANGDYAFSGLPNGSYDVDVTDSDGVLFGYWHSDGPNPGADNNSQVDPYRVSVSGGETNTTGDFGYYLQPGAVGNRVWEDTDGDGVQDGGEPAIAGVDVRLQAVYPDGSTVTVATVTDASGFYTFGNLLIDEDFNGDGVGDEPAYGIYAVPPTGYQSTVTDVSGADDKEDSDANGVVAQAVQGSIDVDQKADPLTETSQASYDFGFLRLAALSGTVIEDENTNGVYDVGVDTVMLAGVTVDLLDATNGLVASTTTDSNGDYAFTNLWPGSYTVKETDPDTHESTGDVYGINDNTIVRTLLSGDVSTDNDYLDAEKVATLALLSSFKAFVRGNDVVVQWETAAEFGTVGFFLERKAVDGSYGRVDDMLIPGNVFSRSGATYECVDPTAVLGGTYTYRLIEVEDTGNHLYLGPYTVTVGGLELSLSDWSRQQFTASQLKDASISGNDADPDKDGSSNYEEYLAGTDPNESVSVLRITAIGLSDGSTEIRWLSVDDRVYTLEVTESAGGVFVPVDTNVRATAPENKAIDTSSHPSGAIYRVRLALPTE